MDLVNKIRAQTATLHEALHQHELLSPLVSSTVTLNDYRFALEAFNAYYQKFEHLFPQNFHSGIASAPVLQWLSFDFRKHKLPPAVKGVTAPRTCALHTRSHAWGYLYTKQGSTLGGSVISQHLKKTLGLRPQVDQHFFAGYGTKTGELWKSFLNELAYNSPSLNHDEVVEGAMSAFEHITDCCKFFLSVKQSNDFNLEFGIKSAPGIDGTTAQRSTTAMC
jgi:heme oxygenase (biliverdin-IX-beta and delta-forming)